MYDKTAEQLTKCPFYVRSQKLSITCECIVEGTETASKFETEREKREFQQNNCFKHHSNCNIKRILEQRYEKS